MKEVQKVIQVLKETKKAISTHDLLTLKRLSDQTIQEASVAQDPDNIAVAVMVYSLGKIYGREDYKEIKGWKDFERISDSAIDLSVKDLEQNNIAKFRKDFEFIKKAINKISEKLKKYIQEVLIQARINKASRLYEHGVSLEKTAKLLDVTMFDVADYAGQTGISEVEFNKTINAKQRVKFAEDIFA